MSNQYQNLISELLLGLLGHTGGAFVISDTGSSGGQKRVPILSKHVDWIDASDKEQLELLILLGSHYAELDAFVEKSSRVNSDGVRSSAYKSALANGVSEVLNSYRSAVLRIEQNLLHSPAPPLLALRQAMTDFEYLLPDLITFINLIETRDAKSSQIMRALDAKANSGDPLLQACAKRLLWHCQRVMMKHLDAWMVHGILIDQSNNEFFIKDNSNSTSNSQAPWHDGCYISLADMPPVIDIPTANKILFIGKAARVLRQPNSSIPAEFVLKAHQDLISFSTTLQTALQHQSGIHPASLKYSIEQMHSKTASLLWDLVQQQCDLPKLLETMHSYFLLGRGDLYQQFLQEAAVLLSKPPRSASAAADADRLFQQGASQTALEASPGSSMHLRWREMHAEVPVWHPCHARNMFVPEYDSWDGLYLEADVQWPLQLFFPPEVLQKYGGLWQYMFCLKRVIADLDNTWALLQSAGRGKTSRNKISQAVASQIGRLRQRMAHFATNLQLYIQIDVVEAATASFKRAIAAATDFSEAAALHRKYVDAMVVQTFLDMRQIMNLVEGIFFETRRLCLLVRDIAEDADVENVHSRLEEIESEFRAKHNLLFQLMQSSKLQSRASALRQLVVRQNFNGFVEEDAVLQLQDSTRSHWEN